MDFQNFMAMNLRQIEEFFKEDRVETVFLYMENMVALRIGNNLTTGMLILKFMKIYFIEN